MCQGLTHICVHARQCDDVVCTWGRGRETGRLGWPRSGNSPVGLQKDRVYGSEMLAAGKAGIKRTREMRVGGGDPVVRG